MHWNSPPSVRVLSVHMGPENMVIGMAQRDFIYALSQTITTYLNEYS